MDGHSRNVEASGYEMSKRKPIEISFLRGVSLEFDDGNPKVLLFMKNLRDQVGFDLMGHLTGSLIVHSQYPADPEEIRWAIMSSLGFFPGWISPRVGRRIGIFRRVPRT